MSTYREIGKRSFKAKWRIYLFEKIINSKLNEITFLDFKKFELSNESINRYTNEYWQEFNEYKINKKTVKEIYIEIKNYENNYSSIIIEFEDFYVEKEFPQIFSELDFNDLKKNETCKYCKITKIEIEELGAKRRIRKKNLRGWSLEIDRLEPNKEYSRENCAMSCYWCNNAKTDEFSESEFKEIGKAVGTVLRNRLNK